MQQENYRKLNRTQNRNGNKSLIIFQNIPNLSECHTFSVETHIYNLCNSMDEILKLVSSCWSFQHNVVAISVFIPYSADDEACLLPEVLHHLIRD